MVKQLETRIEILKLFNLIRAVPKRMLWSGKISNSCWHSAKPFSIFMLLSSQSIKQLFHRFFLRIQGLQNMFKYLLEVESQMGTDKNDENVAGYSVGAGHNVPVVVGLQNMFKYFLEAESQMGTDKNDENTRKQREEDRINFHKFLEAGRAPKEPALLFYEVLVLKTTGYVDVEQNEAYGDIAISKLPKLDQTFLFDGRTILHVSVYGCIATTLFSKVLHIKDVNSVLKHIKAIMWSWICIKGGLSYGVAFGSWIIYEVGEEIAKLYLCVHKCIKQWLMHRNQCLICKQIALTTNNVKNEVGAGA
ncbi:Sister chromatid cohesion protein SCC2 [Glycine soja]